jgi:transposase
MVGRSPVKATEEQIRALRQLAGSHDRHEADHARAILLTVAGWTSARIGEAFGVREDTVRMWRIDFAKEGVDGLKTRIAPGPAPVKAEAALVVANDVLSAPVANRTNWTLPRLQAEIERRSGVAISKSRLSEVLRKKGASDTAGRDTP